MTHIQNSVYHPGDSILHSTGARSKILLALACIFVTGTGGGLALLFMFFLCHLGMLVSGIFILDAWKRLAALKILFLVLGVTPLFLTPGAPLYFSSEFSLPVTKEGLECSVFTVSRLVCMVWISMIWYGQRHHSLLLKYFMVRGQGFLQRAKPCRNLCWSEYCRFRFCLTFSLKLKKQ